METRTTDSLTGRENHDSSVRRFFRILGFGLLLLLPAGIAVAPLAWVMPAPDDPNPFTLCLFTNLTGYHCPGCGMTRAVFCVLHGELAEAWACNRLVVVVFPLLAWLWAAWAWKLGRKIFRTNN